MNLIQNIRQKISGKRDVNLAGSNSIFGTLGTGAFPILSHMDFIPENGEGKTIKLTGEGDNHNAIWIGLDSINMQFWAYAYCSPLASVIDRLAEASTNGRIQFVDADEPEKLINYKKVPKLNRIKKLLNKPNPFQTWEQFDAQQDVICKTFGYCPVWAIGPFSDDKSYTTALVNMSPQIATPNRKQDFNIFKDKSQIENWTLSIQSKQYTIDNKDVFIIMDSFVGKTDDLGLPMSKMVGLDFFVSNICAAMEANNVILKKKGPLGIFSYDPAKDLSGTIPYDPKAKDNLQEDLKRYGLTVGQIQYVISKMPVKWNAMSFNLRDLMTKEIIRDAIDGICDRFNYPAELMSGKNATYENRTSSERFVYQNNVIPFNLRKLRVYTEFFGLEEVAIIKNFNHLPVLQEDIVKAGEAELYQSQSLEVDWTNGIITYNEWRIQKGYDPVEGMDIFYPEYIKKFPLMNPNKPQENGKKPAPKDSSSKG